MGDETRHQGQLGFPQHSRSAEQDKLMKPFEQGVCGFDTEHLNREVNRVIDEENWHWWRAWRSPVPYRFHMYNLIVAAVHHWTKLSEITPEAWEELGRLMTHLEERFQLPGGFIGIRFGSNDYNAGTIAHLHWQVQVPDRSGPGMVVLHKDPILFTLLEMLDGTKGKDPKALESLATELMNLKFTLVNEGVITNVDLRNKRP